MRTFLSFVTVGLLACPCASLAQDPAAQKSSMPTATIIIKVQDVTGRTDTPFTDEINSIEGMTVKAQCKSKNKPMSYVLIELNKHKHSNIDAAMELLSQKKLNFKRINRPESDFSTICDTN